MANKLLQLTFQSDQFVIKNRKGCFDWENAVQKNIAQHFKRKETRLKVFHEKEE